MCESSRSFVLSALHPPPFPSLPSHGNLVSASATSNPPTRPLERLFANRVFILCGFPTSVKRTVSHLLQSYGGTIIDSLMAASTKHWVRHDPCLQHVCVIAPPGACRRQTFLVALALNLPIVHYDYLSEAMKRQRCDAMVLAQYFVPAGFSLRGPSQVQLMEQVSASSLLGL